MKTIHDLAKHEPKPFNTFKSQPKSLQPIYLGHYDL